MRIKFEAGSYNYDGKAIRSIARYKEMGSGWEIEMVLVNISQKYEKPEQCFFRFFQTERPEERYQRDEHSA